MKNDNGCTIDFLNVGISHTKNPHKLKVIVIHRWNDRNVVSPSVKRTFLNPTL